MPLILLSLVCCAMLLARPSAGEPAVGAAMPVSPEFTLSLADLDRLTASLPGEIRTGILSRPGPFLHLIAEVLDQPSKLFVLVDKRHPLPADYVPPDLVSLKDYPLVTTWPTVMLRRSIMPAVLLMVRAAHEEGVTLTFSSGYRSFDYQRGVYNEEVKVYGRKTADRESARPGYSQHQLGTAIDFGSISDAFEATAEGRWVARHAWEYGFSLSYPAGYEAVTGYRHESWHYRYLTKAGTELQRTFFGDIQQYFLTFLSENRALLEKARVT